MSRVVEVSATTRLQKSVHQVNWKIVNFSTVCPEGAQNFNRIISPTFTASENIGKMSKWSANLWKGHDDQIGCNLSLVNLSSWEDDDDDNDYAEFHGVHCTFRMSFGSSHDPAYFSLGDHISSKPAIFSRDSPSWGYGMMSISDLYEQKNILLEDDTLRVRIQMTIYGDPVSLTPSSYYNAQRVDRELKAVGNFSANFQNLFDSKKFTDIEIVCGERSFLCHKNILSARSTVFNAMFDSLMTEVASNKVIVEDLEPPVLAALLQYIYSGQVIVADFDFDSWTQLIYAAEKYDLSDLKNFCFDKMFDRILSSESSSSSADPDENLAILAVTTHNYHAPADIQDMIMNYLKGSMTSLMENPNFRQIQAKNPEAFPPIEVIKETELVLKV